MPNIVVKLHFSSSMSRLSMSTLLLHCVWCIGLIILKNSAMKNTSLEEEGCCSIQGNLLKKIANFPKLCTFFQNFGIAMGPATNFSRREGCYYKSMHRISCHACTTYYPPTTTPAEKFCER